MTSQLLINEPPLQVLPSLAKIVGLNEAIVLQQVHYWLNPHFNTNYFEGRYWVHNTFAQWQKQFFFWSKKTIKRTISALEDSGLLISFVTRNFKKTKYYTLDYGLLNRLHPDGVSKLFLLKTRAEWTEREGDPETAGNQGVDLWGQNGPIEGANVTPSTGAKRENDPKTEENQRFRPWGQNDPLDRDKMTPSRGSMCPPRRGQLDPIDGVNLTPFHYTEITNTNTKITPPLLLPPPSSARGKFEEAQEEEEEEEENKNIKTKNAKQPVYDQMIKIWNETVQGKIHFGQVVHLTEQRETLLGNFLETVLRDRKRIFLSSRGGIWGDETCAGYSELDAWQDYCNLIAKIRFLAGENASGFKVTLDWALVPEKAYKILEGAIYDKPEPANQSHGQFQAQRQGQADQQPWEAFAEDLTKTVPPGLYSSQWLQISQHLAKKLGQIRYKTWFSKVCLAGIADTTATLQVASPFTRNYIDANFRFDILEAIRTLYPTVKYLDFQVAPVDGGQK